MSQGIWITWEKQRRNQGIASELSFPLYEIIYRKPRIIRYLLSTTSTIAAIAATKPKIVVAQNPSIILAILVLSLKFFFRYKVIIDSHNSGIYPQEGRSKILMTIAKFIQKKADLTLVTNKALKSVVESNAGKAFILPDKIPTVPQLKSKFSLQADVTNLACICTFCEDEPYQEIIQAAKLTANDVTIYFTGKYEGKIDTNNIPLNVKLLGFLSEDEYWSLLASSDIIIDLTLRENCLVCGAYEGVAMAKPLLLSDTAALKSYFTQGCIYVKATQKDSIAQGIDMTIKNYGKLKEEIIELKIKLSQDWGEKISKLKTIIYSFTEAV